MLVEGKERYQAINHQPSTPQIIQRLRGRQKRVIRVSKRIHPWVQSEASAAPVRPSERFWHQKGGELLYSQLSARRRQLVAFIK